MVDEVAFSLSLDDDDDAAAPAQTATRARANAARDVVRQVMFNLGIDIDDTEAVVETRRLFESLRDQARRKREFDSVLRKGVIHATITGIVSAIITVAGFIWHLRNSHL